MITEDYSEAEALSELLDSENKSRQELCERIFEEALLEIGETQNLENDKVIVIANENMASWCNWNCR